MCATGAAGARTILSMARCVDNPRMHDKVAGVTFR
jgi:hypothetical protein